MRSSSISRYDIGPVNGLLAHLTLSSQQFEDVKEKVEELVPQLDRFKQNITTATIEGDPEETERRRGLAGYVPQLATAVIITNIIEAHSSTSKNYPTSYWNRALSPDS